MGRSLPMSELWASLFVLSIHLMTVCVCMCLCSVLQFIPQFSPDCEDCGGVPVELPVKAGLAILQVSQTLLSH